MKVPFFYRGIAQSGSAPALGAGCQEFESPYPDHFLPGSNGCEKSGTDANRIRGHKKSVLRDAFFMPVENPALRSSCRAWRGYVRLRSDRKFRALDLSGRSRQSLYDCFAAGRSLARLDNCYRPITPSQPWRRRPADLAMPLNIDRPRLLAPSAMTACAPHRR